MEKKHSPEFIKRPNLISSFYQVLEGGKDENGGKKSWVGKKKNGQKLREE